jgi:folylpolyglutamate synthase/dihydropteroate synthase
MIKQQLQGKLFILYGAAKDKDAAEILALFPDNATLAACTFSNPRSKTIVDWQSLGVNEIYTDVNVAIKEIMAQMHQNDLLWITGSFFLIADLEKESDF